MQEDRPYGSFSGVENYIALVGKKSQDLEEKVGYYGEKLVLKAQELGLSTCWVALTHGRVRRRSKKEKLACVVPCRLREKRGKPPKTKTTGENSATALEKCRTGLPGHGGGASCADSDEPAEILFHAGGDRVRAGAARGL